MTLAGTHLFKIQSSCICLVGMCAYPQYNFLLPRNFFKKGTCAESFLMFSAQCKPHDVRFVEFPDKSVYCLPPEGQLQKNLQTNFSKLGRTETNTPFKKILCHLHLYRII
jgi:hypothetical protein